MYLRFTVTIVDDTSHRAQGVFVAAYSLLDSYQLGSIEEKQLRYALRWFNENLPAPPYDFCAGRAIFWFKTSADENIRRMWELVDLLEHYDHFTQIYKCRYLGNILFEDKFQVAAYPSYKDGRITIR